MEKILQKSHDLFLEKLNKEDIVVDMTIGNGNDTLFLAKNFKFVYGFDIQNIAINNTLKLLKDNNLSNFKLIQDSHEFIDNYIAGEIGGAIYNLGFLPKGDKNITTKADSTLVSLNKTLKLLKRNGLIVIVVYDGHDNGKIEALKLNDFLSTLNQKEYDVLLYKYINQINNPPYIYAILKK